MAQLAIKGHETRGKEIIEILKMLGGKTHTELYGYLTLRGYYIKSDGFIDYKHHSVFNNDILYSLEEFLEKFPYKIGDKVKVCGDNLGVIVGMRWETDYVVYKIKLNKNGYETSKTSENLQLYEETPLYLNEKANKQAEEIAEILEPAKEIMEGVYAYNEINCYHQDFGDKVRIRLGNDFEIKVEDKITYIVKKQPQYPKTYEECCKVLNLTKYPPALVPNKAAFINQYEDFPYYYEIQKLAELLVCRNAYWKIAGEQMGLGKPWEPDYTDDNIKSTIGVHRNHLDFNSTIERNYILIFPTIEMLDAFYENFKNSIEICKELL